MRARPMSPPTLGLAVLVGAMAAAVPAQGNTPKRGSALNAMTTEDPPGLSIHGSATISGVWPVMPCYSNLVLFDPLMSPDGKEVDAHYLPSTLPIRFTTAARVCASRSHHVLKSSASW